MATQSSRNKATHISIHRKDRLIDIPQDRQGHPLKISEYFGINVFNYKLAESIPENIKKEIEEVSVTRKLLNKEHVEIVAAALTEWATSRGATHFCHWFQPLTGQSAEKHDSFLDIKNGRPIEKLSASQLMQGEPDASSFPHGGSRSTFEARGYTSWDITSPMFLIEGINGKTLCIPTAFISYHGDALDIKTPLLRSITALSNSATKFLNLCGYSETKRVMATCGAEQEYFLIDKAFYFARPDLVMSGRTLFGSLSTKNQQLDDHYFGDISERVLSFMQELDMELHKLGIPSKTRHNEVAPGQFEIAPIFCDANIASDNNQILMALIKKIAVKHDFMALLHEKPFAGINGSGKHLNWSMADNTGLNLLEPGKNPLENKRFLATVAIVVEAVCRHSQILRMSIANQGNDHRLGANEAPPSIISIFIGETLDKIFKSILSGEDLSTNEDHLLDLGTDQLAHLLKDNTDRNRTSPFAFTGNRFEFRAVGSSQAIGLPLSLLNAAVNDVLEETNKILEEFIQKGDNIDTALLKVTKKWLNNSQHIIFNGNGYSEEWVKEAATRGLPNLRTTADALLALTDKKLTSFLSESGIMRENELTTRYNVLVERYNALREIEFSTLITLIDQNVYPATIEYRNKLAELIKNQKELGENSAYDKENFVKINKITGSLFECKQKFTNALSTLPSDEQKRADTIAHELMPISEELTDYCNQLEDIIPNSLWDLPKYYDMLFLR